MIEKLQMLCQSREIMLEVATPLHVVARVDVGRKPQWEFVAQKMLETRPDSYSISWGNDSLSIRILDTDPAEQTTSFQLLGRGFAYLKPPVFEPTPLEILSADSQPSQKRTCCSSG